MPYPSVISRFLLWISPHEGAPGVRHARRDSPARFGLAPGALRSRSATGSPSGPPAGRGGHGAVAGAVHDGGVVLRLARDAPRRRPGRRGSHQLMQLWRLTDPELEGTCGGRSSTPTTPPPGPRARSADAPEIRRTSAVRRHLLLRSDLATCEDGLSAVLCPGSLLDHDSYLHPDGPVRRGGGCCH